MNFKKFIQELDENKNFFYEWVQDTNNEDVFYLWRDSDKGYKVNRNNMIIENIYQNSNYTYHPFDNDILKSSLDSILSEKMKDLNKLDGYDNIFEKWLVDKQDNSKYYYWRGCNKGYVAIVENDNNKMPKIKEIQVLDRDYLEPKIMKEFKDYKIKRALEQKLKDINEENLNAKKDIFGHWMEDDDNTFYYWKDESNGYMALIENENLPEITKFELVDNEYFEPRSLKPIENIKIKKVLDKKIK